MLPAGAGCPGPPVAHVPQVNRMIRRRENQRARLEHLIRRFGRAGRNLLLHLFPVDGFFGGGHVSRRLDKLAELGVGDVMLVHPESLDLHFVGGSFIRHGARVVGAHGELPAGNPDHVCGTFDRRRGNGLAAQQSVGCDHGDNDQCECTCKHRGPLHEHGILHLEPPSLRYRIRTSKVPNKSMSTRISISRNA